MTFLNDLYDAFFKKLFPCASKHSQNGAGLQEELQTKWYSFVTNVDFRKTCFFKKNDFYDTVSSNISGHQPVSQLICPPRVDGNVELRVENYAINVFGTVPMKRGEFFVGLWLKDGPYETVKAIVRFGCCRVNHELQIGVPCLAPVIPRRPGVHNSLIVDIYPYEAVDHVYFVYAFLKEDLRKNKYASYIEEEGKWLLCDGLLVHKIPFNTLPIHITSPSIFDRNSKMRDVFRELIEKTWHPSRLRYCLDIDDVGLVDWKD
jgi:hypothetical protein